MKLLSLGLIGACVGCGTATSADPEELTDPGLRDASENRALELDGVDDYASVGTARVPQIMRDQTYLVWFRPEGAVKGAKSDLQVLFTLRRSSWSGIALALDQGVPLAYNVFGPRDLARAESAPTLHVWHHLALVVQEGAGTTLYVDGVAAPPGSETQTNRTPVQAYLGGLDAYRDPFHGGLDELRLYDRAFTAEEVAAVVAGAKPSEEDPPVLYLPFNEESGARCYDRSGNGNHAELGDGVPEAMPVRVPSTVP